MRLIDADKLKKDVLNLQDCYNGFSDTYDKACIIGVIDEQPSAQPEIIRCKECKHSSPNGVYGCRLERYNFNDESVRMYGEDSCSYGERRTDGEQSD